LEEETLGMGWNVTSWDVYHLNFIC
jgi:hypothetical protein